VVAASSHHLKLRPTAGAGENLALINNPKSGVDIAFVQGGIGDPFGAPDLMSLASVFLEPLWVFVRTDGQPRRLTELKGKRIAIGAPGSGTRVLAKTLLVASGIDDENSVFQSIGGAAAARALRAGEIDAELDRIQRQVGHLKVPLSYAEQLYDLRLHIGFVKQLLRDLPKAG
jgi:TRAP-type uncharacterized transport system substrate-binding protein